MPSRGSPENSMQVSSEGGWKDSRPAPLWNSRRAESRNSMRCSVAVFPVGLSWNCAAQLLPGGRAWLFLCLRRPRNGRKHVRLSMFRILLTRFLSRLQEWNSRDCFGFDAEKPGTEDRISKLLHTLLLRTKKLEKLAVSIPRARSQRQYMVGFLLAES